MDDREIAAIPQRLERRQPRVESEEPVEVDCRPVAAVGPRDRDRRPGSIVVVLSVRNDDAQAIDGTALKNRNQLFRTTYRAGGKRGPREERRREPEAHQRERSVFQKYTS